MNMGIISEAQSKSIHSFIHYISIEYEKIFNNEYREYIELFTLIASQTLEKIANCDAPYHNLEHTIGVTLVGQEIIYGKYTCEELVSPQEWINYMISLLCHDIGYVKGICSGDRPAENTFATGIGHDLITLPAAATGASLTPYHVDRGKLFIAENFSSYKLINLDAIELNIELTRFPAPKDELHNDIIGFPGLTRAADLIGQLSDPCYLSKLPALFSEFEEIGTNKFLGYNNPKDLRAGYPRFYWHVVSLYLTHSIRYLETTQAGKAILENLYGNRATVEKELDRFYNEKSNIFNRIPDLFKKFNKKSP